MSEKYTGKNITIYFDGKKCVHSRNCVLGLARVFQGGVDGPWINPDGAPVDDLVAVAQSCPSGAITYEKPDGTEHAPDVNVIRVLENGPYAVRADIQIPGRATAIRVTLCRCGASANKPYCDGKHKTIKFKATGEPPVEESNPLTHRGGKLTFTPAPDGPLLINGNVEIIAGTGQTVNRAQRAALCRCGASATKPYCDGSHQKIHFKS